MEFSDVLRDRRSVRSYQDRPIEAATLRALLDAAILAPSAVNNQPWEFWAILGREQIEDLSQRVKAWLIEKVAHDPTGEAVHQRQQLAAPDLSPLHHAPALVLVATKSFGKQADEDCCLAALTLMLAARNVAIGSCWIGSARPWFNLAATKTELGIPETVSIVAPIVLGYPTAWPATNGRNAANIHWIG